jgi:hypothetical protein
VWVNDWIDYKVRKFNADGTIALEISVDYNFTKIRNDYFNGFWAYNGTVDNVYHYNSSGIKDVDVHFDRIDGISTHHEGCTVFDTGANVAYFLNWSGTIYRTLNVESEVLCPEMFSLSYDKDKEWNQSLVPPSYDPVWGSSSGNLEWEEVKKDGYFLPKVRFHQLAITLRGDATLEKVILAPAVKTQDIAPGTSKNIYVRTNIPYGTDATDYETKLRSWWGEVE